jgi:hypothetical protein
MDTLIPQNQIIYRSEAYQKYHSISSDPKIYLTRFVNLFLTAFVSKNNKYSAKIINLNPFFTNYKDGVISFIVQPGTCVIDSTLIEFQVGTELDIDISEHPECDHVVIYSAFKFGTTSKAIIQVGLLNTNTHIVVTDERSLFSLGYSFVILGLFKLIRDETGHLIRIHHPYGQFVVSDYISFLKSIKPTVQLNSNIDIYDNIYQSADLYKPFKIGSTFYQLLPTIFLNKESNDSLAEYINDKLRRRYLIPNIDNYYYHKFDRRLNIRTEMCNDEYSYAL